MDVSFQTSAPAGVTGNRTQSKAGLTLRTLHIITVHIIWTARRIPSLTPNYLSAISGEWSIGWSGP